MTKEKYNYWELDFTKPNKNCDTCEIDENYTCIACESEQVKKIYPKATLNNECLWILNQQANKQKG